MKVKKGDFVIAVASLQCEKTLAETFTKRKTNPCFLSILGVFVVELERFRSVSKIRGGVTSERKRTKQC